MAKIVQCERPEGFPRTSVKPRLNDTPYMYSNVLCRSPKLFKSNVKSKWIEGEFVKSRLNSYHYVFKSNKQNLDRQIKFYQLSRQFIPSYNLNGTTCQNGFLASYMTFGRLNKIYFASNPSTMNLFTSKQF